MSIDLKQLHKIETHREVLIKFILLLSLLGLYFAYLSFEYGILTGGVVALITWSFFVLCTPVADAGFLLDFPIRVLLGFRMLYSEIMVWGIAAGINIYTLNFNAEAYDKTILTALFKKILITPYPYWSILIISAMGTFLSLYFGDEMLDVLKHRDCVKCHQHAFKLKIIVVLGLFAIVLAAYYFILNSLEIDQVLESL